MSGPTSSRGSGAFISSLQSSDERDAGLNEPSWGIADAAVGWLVAFFASALLGALIVAAAGFKPDDDLPLWLLALSYPPLWIGFIGAPLLVAATKGNGWVKDFRVAIRWIDVPIGLLIGVVTQIVVVPLVSAPVLWLSGQSTEDLARPARELADKAVGPGGALLFILIVGIGAPIAEELFFRGLMLRAFEKKWGKWVALGASSIWFGATHFQPLQFAALSTVGAIFGFLAIWSRRLGLAVTAHMGFNLTTVVVLLWLT